LVFYFILKTKKESFENDSQKTIHIKQVLYFFEKVFLILKSKKESFENNFKNITQS